MISRSYFLIILAITFLGSTTATSYSSWDRASTSFDIKTNDQIKRRLKSEIPERISQFGGDSMPNSLAESVVYDKDDDNPKGAARRYEKERIDSGFYSGDHKYQDRDGPLRQMTGGHHTYKNNHYKKRMHDSSVDDFQMPFETHGQRLRRKLDDEKSNGTLNSNSTQHNDTQVEMHGPGGEERVNGTKKPCIKSHPYKLISSPPINVTQNNTGANNTKTPVSDNNPSNHTVTTDHDKPRPNATLDNKNETKENSSTSMNEKAKSPMDAPSPNKDTTSKENGSGKSSLSKGQGFGLPCNVLGQWVSEAGGVTMKIKASQNKSNLDIDVQEQSPKKGFLSPSWKISGNLPFIISGNSEANDTGIGGPIVLTATILKDPSDNGKGKVAVFLGECRACYEGMESIVGTWNLKSMSKDCLDATLSQNEVRDVFHREITSNANEKAKSGDSEAEKPKDGVDQSKKPHTFWRRSYNKEGRQRRHLRTNSRYM